MAKKRLAEFKNVGLLKETHVKMKKIADVNERTISRQLKIIIDKEYNNMVGDPPRNMFAKDHVFHNLDLSDPDIE